MVRRIVVLILVLSGSLLTGRAQEGTRVADGDTLHYTYTPLPQEAPRKKPFLRRGGRCGQRESRQHHDHFHLHYVLFLRFLTKTNRVKDTTFLRTSGMSALLFIVRLVTFFYRQRLWQCRIRKIRLPR